MTSDLRIQGEVVVNSEQAESAFNRVGDKAQQMATEVATSATKAGQAVDKIGDGAGASAEKFTRAESRISASIKRATNELELLGKTASQRLEFNISDKGLDATKFEPALKKLREIEAQAQQAQRAATGSLDKMGISAAQTAAALRGVPAQFTDIVTSLQGGQAPLTVVLQQGGQLKDMFGGAGNAARALGGYVLGLVNPFTVAAAAVAGLGVAMYSINGKDAALQALSTQLTGTGRASAAAVGDIKALVNELNTVPGVSKAAATSIITEFAKVSGVGAELFKSLGSSVADFAAATGTDLPTAAKKLAEAFADPAKGAKTLEDSLGTLTAAQILTITKMAEMGDKSGAQVAMMAALKQAVEGLANDAMTPLGRSSERLSNAWDVLMTSMGDSGGIRAVNDMFAGMIDKIARITTGLAQMRMPPWLEEMFKGGLNGMVYRGLKGSDGGATGSWGPPVAPSGATGSWGAPAGTAPPQSDLEGQVKAALELTRSYESQSAAMEKLRGVATTAKDALKALESQNKGNSVEANTLRERIAGVNEKLAEMAKKGQGAATKEHTAYASLIATIKAKIATNNEEIAGAGRLTESDKLRIKLMEELNAGSKTLTASHKARALALLDVLGAQDKEQARIKSMVASYKQEAEIAEELAQAYVAQSKAREAGRTGVQAYATGIDESSKALQYELSLMGLGEQARNVALEQYRIELALKKEIAAIDANTGFDETQREEERAKARAAAAIATANASSKAFLDEWKQSVSQYDDIFRKGFADMLNNGKSGWKSFTQSLVTTFKTTVADQIYKMFAQKFVVNIVGNLMGVTGALGGAAGAANAGSSALSTAGSIGSGYSALSGIGGAFGGGLSGGFGGLMGSLGLSATGSTLGGAVSAGGIALSSGNILGGLGTLVGALGPIALGIGVLASIFAKDDSGTYHTGGAGSYSAAGGASTGAKVLDQGLTFGVRYKDYNSQAEGAAVGISQSIVGMLDATAKSFGNQAGYFAATAFADDSSKDGAWGSLIIKRLDDTVTNWADTQTSKWAPKVFSDGEAGQKEYAAALAMSVRDALVGAVEGVDWAQSLLTGLGDAPTLEGLQGVVATINAAQEAFKGFGQYMPIFTDLTQAAVSGLVAASGGVQALTANMSTFVDGFYTDAEKLAINTQNVTDALANLGFEMPKTREEFKALVQSQIALGAAGANTTAGLLAVSGAVSAVLPPFEDAAAGVETAIGTVSDAMRRLQSDTASLQIDLLRAQGNTTGANAAQRTLDTTGLGDAEIAVYDYNESLRAQINVLNDAAQAAADQAEIRAGFERQLLEMQGDTTALRLLDIAGLDAANVALYDRVQALQAEQTAVQATVEASQKAVEAERGLISARAQAAQQAYSYAQAATGAALASIDRSVGAQREVFDASRSAALEAAQEVRSLIDTLSSGIKGLYGEVESARTASAAEGLAFIDNALRNARATGYLPDSSALNDAISSASSGIGAKQYTSQADQDFDRLVLAGQLKELNGYAEPQLTAAEQAARIAEDQIKALDDILRNARDQVDELRGIDTSVKTIPEALAALQAALVAESQAQTQAFLAGTVASLSSGQIKPQDAIKQMEGNGAVVPREQWTDLAGTQAWVSTGGATALGGTPTSGLDAMISSKTGAQFTVRTATDYVNDAVRKGDLRAIYDAAVLHGISSTSLDAMMGWPGGTALDWAKSQGLPAFAVGTNYVPRDMVARIHEGEAIVPKAYNPAAGGSGGQSNARLEALIEKLNAEVAELKGLQRDSNRNTRRTAEAVNGNPDAPILVTTV